MTDAVMTEGFASMIPMLATVLLHFVWQGALVGVFAWMALSALHAARPQARYLVACLALLACVLLPMLTFAKLYLMGDATSTDTALALTTTAANAAPAGDPSVLATLSSPSNPAMPWIVLLWAAGAGALSLRMACGLWWVRRLRTSAPCGDAQRWEVCVDRLAYRFGIRRQVTVRLVADGDSPLSIGWLKPMVLLPAAIAARMPAPLFRGGRPPAPWSPPIRTTRGIRRPVRHWRSPDRWRPALSQPRTPPPPARTGRASRLHRPGLAGFVAASWAKPSGAAMAQARSRMRRR